MLVHHGQTIPDSRRIQIDGFFTENRFTGFGCSLNQIGMGIGRRADTDSVNIVVGHGLFDSLPFHAGISGAESLGISVIRFNEGINSGFWILFYVGRMHLANAPDPNNAMLNMEGSLSCHAKKPALSGTGTCTAQISQTDVAYRRACRWRYRNNPLPTSGH